uniref:Reverse transcriptase zinc-binding domain-containing protein n=1 Tax=Ananas comosus var. bracteatus TaxID=296719 RepID=A0A6V7Q2I5_ANACO|nr:unnamed protein product [Ananas comosus var. bracteatus]
MDGRFIVRSTYSALNNGSTRDAHASKIWRLEILLKVQVFTWLILRKRTATTNNLLKKGWTGNTKCALYDVEEETVDHLFTQCVINKFLIAIILEGVESRDLEDGVRCTWNRWMLRNRSQPIRIRLISLIVCWWVI